MTLNINTFIFDLGGVIIDLDEPLSYTQLLTLSNQTSKENETFLSNTKLFHEYEQGFISTDDFRMGLRRGLGITEKDEEIDLAWNAMIGDIPLERFELLLELKQNHKVIILSNTNDIHELCFNRKLKEITGKDSLNHYAHHVFFSHKMGMRKPNADIYQKVLRLTETNAANSLFLDDKLENLKGAEKVGIRTLHISHPDNIVNVLKYA